MLSENHAELFSTLYNQPIETCGDFGSLPPPCGEKFSSGEVLTDLNDISSVSGDDSTTTGGSLVTMTTWLPTGNLLAGMAGGRFDDVMWEAAGGEKKEKCWRVYKKTFILCNYEPPCKLIFKFKNCKYFDIVYC